jgi:hypothetical protein
MPLPITIRRAARAEFLDAADWYEQRRNGLGVAFTMAVEDILQKIAVQPKRHPRSSATYVKRSCRTFHIASITAKSQGKSLFCPCFTHHVIQPFGKVATDHLLKETSSLD